MNYDFDFGYLSIHCSHFTSRLLEVCHQGMLIQQTGVTLCKWESCSKR